MKTPPEIVIPDNVELPPVETVRLANGLQVYVVASDEQEVGRLSLVWAAGSAMQSKAFVASSTLNLLAEGSERFTAQQIAEKLDFVGSYFDVSIDRDYAVATFCWLEKFAAPTLEVTSEIVLAPVFPDREVEIHARKRMERLALERAKPSTKAREAFTEALFGADHPYGVVSPESEYLNLTRDDMVAFRERFYGADNCFAVCSLGSDPAQKEAVLEFLGRVPSSAGSTSWESTCSASRQRTPEGGVGCAEFGAPTTISSDPPSVSGFTIPHSVRRVIPIAGAVQSSIRVGRVLFPRQHPDFVGMQVVATILGGYFGSRLVRNLREQRGYTYGVMAAMVNLRAAGYLAISTEVAAEATEDAVEQIFVETERLRVELVGEDELENVRRSMLGEVMRILDGPFGIVDVVIENVQLGEVGREGRSRHENYLVDFIRQVEEITPERIRSLALKYLDREAFTVVVVGASESRA